MLKKLSAAFFWIFIFQVIGYCIGQVTQVNITTWYKTLNKSILTPPDIVFAIVWTILYVMLALAGWSLWLHRGHKKGNLALVLYWIQMLINWAWTPIFFSLHHIALGLYLIIIMLTITTIVIWFIWKYNKFLAMLLLPYCFWLLFACYLNWIIFIKN